jgi:UDP-glucuronate decarboxylase
VLAMMDSDDSVTGPVNFGNPHEVTILDIARKVIGLSGSASRIVFKELPVDDPTRRKPDITKAKNLFGWEPAVGLEEGLIKTIEYFKK